MSVYKDKNGTWYVMTRCDDWQGQRKQKCKRGFKTKREAQDWERRFLLQQGGDLDMLFKDFYKLYEQDMKARLKQNTWEHKACVIKSKILPYFGEKSMKDIQARDVLTWQNELLRHRDKNGKPYSETYLKNLHNQLSCIFNHAVRYYDLSTNPAAKAGSIGVKNAKEMNFWTKDEYMQFSEVMMDKPISFYAFEMLYWCGIRLGELLALTTADFDFKNRKLRINKSYQRLKVKAILNYIPDYKKEFQVEDECEQLCRELTSLLDGKLSIMKHSDEIISKAQRLSKIMKKLSDSTHKSGDTVYALRERLDRSLKETEDVRQRLKQTSGECSELRRDVSSLQAEVDDLTEFVSLLKRFEPQKYAEVRQAQEHIHNQREQEVQQSATRKKKSWGLE